MARWYTNTPEVQFPDLFFEVSNGLQYLVEHYGIKYTKGELCLMRQRALRTLRNLGITQETYNPVKDYLIKFEAEFTEVNRMYKTYHSSADIKSKGSL